MKQIVLASSNEGKVKEFREILTGSGFTINSLRDLWNPPPEIPETGNTFFDNARMKADWVFDRTGIFTLADDSGLEVDALQGLPGIRSARFAGEHANAMQNNQKLLEMLVDIPEGNRSARFKCVLVLKTGEGKYLSAEGVCEGRIALHPSGGGGFGYDPLFIPDGFDRSFGELDSLVKHSISHRGRAIVKFKEKLDDLS